MMNTSQLARYLLLFVIALLIFFGIGTIANLGSHPELAGVFIFYALAVFVEAAVLLFCFFRLRARNKRIFWLVIVILAANIIAGFLDQIGFIDVFYMLANLAALVTLYLSRKDYLPE